MATITPETSRPSRRGRHRAERPTITPLTGVSEAAARTGAIAAVTGGMLASVFSSSAGAAPAAENSKQTVDYGKADARVADALADELVSQVKVSPQAETVVETSTIKVTPYAETPEGKAEAKRIAEEERQAELEKQRQAELEAQRQAELEAQAAAEAEAEATAAAEATTSTSTGSATGQQAVNLAMELVGTPYVLGGSTPSEGLDCSGLITYVYGQLGVTNLPRTSGDLRYAGTVVSDPQPGDIVWTSGHVSLYAGNGMIVEAVQPGTPLRYTTMWQSNPTFVRVA
ncbi:hypothetical protein GCM10027059_31430 [Myceligenerans halotolerans]